MVAGTAGQERLASLRYWRALGVDLLTVDLRTGWGIPQISDFRRVRSPPDASVTGVAGAAVSLRKAAVPLSR